MNLPGSKAATANTQTVTTMASYRFNPTPSGGGNSSANSLLVTTATTLGASLLITQLLTPADPLGKSLRFLKQLGRQVRAIYMLLYVMIRPTITKIFSSEKLLACNTSCANIRGFILLFNLSSCQLLMLVPSFFIIEYLVFGIAYLPL